MFKEIIKKSFYFSWQNPIFWPFGFLATIFLALTNQIFLLIFSLEKIIKGDFFVFIFKIINLKNFLPLYGIFLFFVFLIILIINIFSENFLIFSLKEKINEKEFDFKKSFKIAKENIPLVFIICLFNFFVFGFFLTLIYLLKEKSFFLFWVIFFWLSTILFLPFFTIYIIFSLLTKEKSIKKSLSSAFFFFKKNWLKIIFLTIILFLILIIFAFLRLAFFETGLLTFPLRLIGLFLIKSLGKTGFIFTLFLDFLVVFFLEVIFTGFFVTYQTSCWVLFFLKSEESVNKNKKE